jgi:hypothetical protein
VIRVTFPNLEKIGRDLTTKTLKQFAFATSQALNDTGTQFQQAERQHVQRTMTVRQKTYILNSIKIPRGSFATKEKLEVTILIDPERNQLARHERGGDKTSIQGKPYVAIPLPDLRRTKRGLVPRKMYPSALGPFQDKGTIATGQQRTVIVPTKAGDNRVMLQRFGGARGKKGTRALYLFVPKVTIPASLEFQDNAKAVMRSAFHANFKRRLAAAIRTAR